MRLPRSLRPHGCITYTTSELNRQCQRHKITGWQEAHLYRNRVQEYQLDTFLNNFRRTLSTTNSLTVFVRYTYLLVHILARHDMTKDYCFHGAEIEIVNNGVPMYVVCFDCASHLK